MTHFAVVDVLEGDLVVRRGVLRRRRGGALAELGEVNSDLVGGGVRVRV